MHDGVTLEQQGIPVATIITEVFVSTAKAYTQLLGVPNFPYLVFPHPITNVGHPELEIRSKGLAPKVATLLLEGFVPMTNSDSGDKATV